MRQGGHTQIENTGGAGTSYRTSSQITGRENIWIRFVDATTDAVGPLLDGGRLRHEILVFSIANFCQATAAPWHALSVHLCELGTCPKWGMKSCQIPLSIESCQLRSETLLLYVGHWRPMLTSTVCDLA